MCNNWHIVMADTEDYGSLWSKLIYYRSMHLTMTMTGVVHFYSSPRKSHVACSDKHDMPVSLYF